jgi:hypothetical protein
MQRRSATGSTVLCDPRSDQVRQLYGSPTSRNGCWFNGFAPKNCTSMSTASSSPQMAPERQDNLRADARSTHARRRPCAWVQRRDRAFRAVLSCEGDSGIPIREATLSDLKTRSDRVFRRTHGVVPASFRFSNRQDSIEAALYASRGPRRRNIDPFWTILW